MPDLHLFYHHTFPVAPIPTIAVILVAEFTTNEVAATPPKVTAETPVKLVPAMVTDVPFVPLVGVNDEIVGGTINVNPANDAVPAGVVTLTLPDAPVATTAVILVEEFTTNDVAVTPPNRTAVAPVKFVPVIVIVAPVAPVVGVNDEIIGGGININPANDAVPAGVVTLTLPVAPAPTMAVMLVEEFTTNDAAATPPKLTAVTPVKFVPVIVTVVPVPADVGVNDEMVGGRINVNPASVAVPPDVVTLTLPDAPEPTTVVIFVEEFTTNDVAATPPKLTAVVPVKFAPVIDIVAPVPALVGVKDEIVGGPININPANDAVPAGVVTLTLPDAPEPTTAVIVVEFTIVKEFAAVPPKLIAVAPVKLVPVIVIVPPPVALVGVNDVIVGTGIDK